MSLLPPVWKTGQHIVERSVKDTKLPALRDGRMDVRQSQGRNLKMRE